jgi:RNA polymerase sigma-70 factor (sigma-E family)
MSFEDWVGARGAALLRFALMVCADAGRAEDLVQSVLTRVYPKWSYIRSLDAPEAYVKAAIVNEHLKWWRRRSNREIPATMIEDRPSPTDLSEEYANREAGWQLLRRLPPKQRAVLALRYYDDMADDQIAGVLGCSVSTVRSQASRALAALRTVVTTDMSAARVSPTFEIEAKP